MTTEEAIDILNNTAWLGSDNGIRVYPAVKMAVTALENQSKHRWHDLRKDPTDLPKRDVLCLTIDEFDNLNLGYLSSYSVCNIWTGYRYLSIRQPIAWREIEPFEVEDAKEKE